MRKLLLVAMVVGCVLLVGAPAEAVHLYFKMKPQGASTYVETSCKAGQRLSVRVGTSTQSVTVPAGSGGKFTTSRLNTVARRSGPIYATCNGHPLRTARLATTGTATGWELTMGFGLVVVGTLFVLLGRRPPTGPRRPRPPVKVYAQ